MTKLVDSIPLKAHAKGTEAIVKASHTMTEGITLHLFIRGFIAARGYTSLVQNAFRRE